jgi:YHS domain-containing protein
MDDLLELERQIQERLDAANARRLANHENLRREMEEHEQRRGKFEAAAERLTDNVIRPRLDKLASLFTNAHVSDKDQSIGYGCVCRFDHTPEYPASTTLNIGVSADSTMENAILTYHLEILPIFFQFEGQDQLVAPLDRIDDEAVASWVNAKLLGFTDTYLRVQVIEQYQHSNMVVDPVCGMRINRADAEATAEYGGQRYYFCVEQCHQKFLSDPERYAPRRPA